MDKVENKQAAEMTYISTILIPELHAQMRIWNEEYASQERDLGIKAEFVNLWRKAKKVKALVWDGADETTWREGLRTVLLEIIGHALLMLFDIDRQDMQHSPTAKFAEGFTMASRKIRKEVLGAQVEDLLSRDKLVPHCGHPRCVEHVKLPLYELSAANQQMYHKEIAEGNGNVGPVKG